MIVPRNSAAIYGLRGKSDISIFILHPKNRVSPIQEAQMTTVTDSNVHNIAVQGTFDDCQDIVKALFADTSFNEKYHLGAVNSINWARILAQIVYYFKAYFDAQKQLPNGEGELQFVVPTGNFGDVLAGWYAKQMGVPMAKLVVATNANDILARFWASGRYEKQGSPSAESAVAPGVATEPAAGASDGAQAQAQGGVQETLSPAMDILISSNFERLLWYLARDSLPSAEFTVEEERSAKACAVVKGWMDSMKADGRAVVSTEALTRARKDFAAERVDDAQTLATIQEYFEAKDGFADASYVADPHTAVGLTVGRRIAPSNPATVHQIILSTAHPAKFSEAVTRALSNTSSSFSFERDVLPEEFKGLLEMPRRVIDVPRAEVGLVKEVIIQTLTGVTEKSPGEANASV
ncbi:tryptophan synthase beta subunit-like PLP-dependent enzyme [Clavulina sp. PMI_390]|nr:tryptophan synthase beta subunit-like PLP-dependent enzyme [Clavulina sp. PMI_390]